MKKLFLTFLLLLHVSSAAFGNESVKVNLSWKFQFEFAGLIAAKEKGFFREEGFENVDLIEWEPGQDVAKNVEEGKADFGVLGSGLILEVKKGRKLTAVAALMQHSAVAIMANKKSGIDGVNDLSEKKIALSHDTEPEIMAYLKEMGMEKKVVRIENAGFGLEALKNGADAVAIYESNEGIELTRNNSLLILKPRMGGVDAYGNILFTSEKMAKDKKKVAAFKRAVLKGQAYAFEHREELIELLSNGKYATQKKTKEELAFEASKLFDLTRPDLIEIGYISKNRLNGIVKTFFLSGWVSDEAPIDEVIFDEKEHALDLSDNEMLTLLAGIIFVCGWSFYLFFISRKLKKLNKNLLSEIKQKNIAMDEATFAKNEAEKAKTDAEKANAFKDAFLAKFSHEIKTPLNGLLGFTSMAHEESKDQVVKNLLSEAETAGAELLNLLNEVLDYSKIKEGPIALMKSPFRPVELIEKTARLFTAKCLQKNLPAPKVEPMLGSLNLVIGDKIRISQILNNLMSNAVKFTSKGSIKIRCGQKNKEIWFEVEDTGSGISEESLGKIFLPFVQEDDSITRQHGGTGLGLSVADGLAKMMGGSLLVESSKDGSTFTLVLPIEVKEEISESLENAEAAPDEIELKKESSPAKSILVVEDHPMNRKLVCALIEKLGIAYLTANNGVEGVECFKKNENIKMILMDIQMPVMDGVEATLEIRKEENGGLPIIAITANTSEKDIERYKEAGMTEVTSKPFTFETLKRLVDTYFN